MKKLVFILLIAFISRTTVAQSLGDYELIMKRVQQYINAGQIDYLCSLFQPNNAGTCVWSDEELTFIQTCFGKIQSTRILNLEQTYNPREMVYIEVVCSKRTVVLTCKLNELLKFSHFEFNDKSLKASRIYKESLK